MYRNEPISYSVQRMDYVPTYWRFLSVHMNYNTLV